MKMLDIAGTSLRRFIRDRSNLFFVVVFPMLLVLAIGLVFGGSSVPRLGVVVEESDELAAEVVASLEANDSIVVERVGERSDLEIDVERQTLSAGLAFPDDYGERILSGDTVTIDYFAQPGTIGSNVAVAVDAAIAEQATRVRAASVVAGDDGELEEALAVVDAIEGPGIEVLTVSIETDGPDFTDFGQFGFGAAQELALFVWITSLTSAAYLIENRQMGVVRRMAATPTGTGRILVGELLGRFGIAFIQASLIVVASALLFGVEWGDPVAVALLVIAYCMVGTGAGMLLGSLLNNESQSTAVGLGLGLGLAALGGAMVPLEIFSDGMKQLAHTVTPHAWLIDGITELVTGGGGVSEVLTEIAVLATAGAILIGLALLAFRRAVTTG